MTSLSAWRDAKFHRPRADCLLQNSGIIVEGAPARDRGEPGHDDAAGAGRAGAAAGRDAVPGGAVGGRGRRGGGGGEETRQGPGGVSRGGPTAVLLICSSTDSFFVFFSTVDRVVGCMLLDAREYVC